jgi:hypothetical protein
MELLVPVVGIGWHFRRALLAGVLVCVSCGMTVHRAIAQTSYTVLTKAAVVYLDWAKPSDRKDS